MRVHITIDLPDGRSAEFAETPIATTLGSYRRDARQILDRLHGEARRWLDEQEKR